MTRAIAQQAIVWRRVFRLVGALGPTAGKANPVILGLIVAWLTLIGFIGLMSRAKLGDTAGFAMMWFVMTVYCLHFATGLFNKGWRILPASLRELRAAAWIIVSLLPLVITTLSTLVDIGLAGFVGEHDLARRGLAQFGLRALAMESYALIAICFGNWPGSAATLWWIERRTWRDWMMFLGILVIVAGVVLGAGFAQQGAAGWICSAVAVALCVALLPVALRVLRLDQPQSAAGAFDALSDSVQRRFGLKLSGWTGHFVREARRTALFWAWMALALWGTSRLLPPAGGLDSRDAAFREGLRQGMSFGMASLVWMIPAMAGALMATMTQQYLLRSRLLLLSLPHGARLIMITPLFNAMLVFVATLGLTWPEISAEPGLGTKLAISGCYGLAMVYTGLACNLGATTYARVLANSLVISLPLIGAAAMGALASRAPDTARVLLVPIGAVSLVVLAAALVWCRWQLRHSRALYRPWPGAASGWRTA